MPNVGHQARKCQWYGGCDYEGSKDLGVLRLAYNHTEEACREAGWDEKKGKVGEPLNLSGLP